MRDIMPMIVREDTPLISVMRAIDQGGLGIALLCDEGRHLMGTVTDGDVRRHILRGGSLATSAFEVANLHCITANEGEPPQGLRALAVRRGVPCIPIVNAQGMLVDLYVQGSRRSHEQAAPIGLPIVIMAGGMGTRLYPYTKILPKPLIPIGDRTITEWIMHRFKAYACHEFYMVVSHKKNLIKAYFADAGAEDTIHFIDEEEPLGTGGGLDLLRGKIDTTFFLTNCDILVFEDYKKILDHHKEAGNIATMVCVTKSVTIPYGTVEVGEDGRISSMVEKPSFSFLTNTGLYVFEPGFFDYVPERTFIHIPDILQVCMQAGARVGIYPITEDQWSDMGQPEELEKMRERLESE